MRVRDAIFAIKDLGYRNLPVVDSEQKLVGIVTRSAIVSQIYDGFWSQYTPDLEAEHLIGGTAEEIEALVQADNGSSGGND